MIARTEERARGAKLHNLDCRLRDVLEDGFGLPPGGVDAVMLFNILHCESPEVLLRHASYATREGGHVLVIHWRYDPGTPRGPEMAIRPRPEQIVAWAHATGRLQALEGAIDLPPWHYGVRLARVA